jgi:PEP-CTERM motif
MADDSPCLEARYPVYSFKSLVGSENPIRIGGPVKKSISILFSMISMAYLASAGVVVDHYPVNGTITAYNITNGYIVSDSFSLSSPATLTGVNLGMWLSLGDSLNQLTWSIGSSPNTSTYGTGTASVSLLSTVFSSNPGYGLLVVSDTFSLPSISLGAGTYYLSLQNGITSQQASAFWDENNAPGVDAWQINGDGHLSAGGCAIEGQGTCAEAFQLLSNSSSAPEPGTFATLGLGLAIASCIARRKTRRS